MFQAKLLCYGFDYIHWYLHLLFLNFPFGFDSIESAFLTNVFIASNIVRACHNLSIHILALEGDNEVFNKVFEPFCEHDVF